MIIGSHKLKCTECPSSGFVRVFEMTWSPNAGVVETPVSIRCPECNNTMDVNRLIGLVQLKLKQDEMKAIQEEMKQHQQDLKMPSADLEEEVLAVSSDEGKKKGGVAHG